MSQSIIQQSLLPLFYERTILGLREIIVNTNVLQLTYVSILCSAIIITRVLCVRVEGSLAASVSEAVEKGARSLEKMEDLRRKGGLYPLHCGCVCVGVCVCLKEES